MKADDLSTGAVLARLVECTRHGAQVELTLRNGQKIGRFRVHEVIAPQGLMPGSHPGEARARGVVWPDHGTRRDEYIQVRDIQSVRDELVDRFSESEGFFHRHPLPLNWVRLARCPMAPKPE